MRFSYFFLIFFCLSAQAACPAWPLIVAHRGASGSYPEHTEIAYWQAMLQGADFIEADLVPTKDGVLISRHENELSQSTNVADLSQFASRKTTKLVDGVQTEGWFSEDFSLAEIRQLKARESKPAIRPGNIRNNDRFGILTLAEVMQLVQRFELQTGRKVGLYLETKHPTYFGSEGRLLSGQSINRNISAQLLQQLSVWQQTQNNPIFIQSFEISNLWWMRQQGLQQYQVNAKLVQLIGDISGAALYPKSNFAEPWDLVSRPASTQILTQQQALLGQAGFHYGTLITPDGLKFLSQYADGIGPWKEQWYPQDFPLFTASQLKPYGLQLHPYTFRAEAEFLPGSFATLNDELQLRYQQGVDGVFTDFTAIAVKVRTETCSAKSMTKQKSH